MSAVPILEVDGISMRFGKFVALNNVTTKFEAGKLSEQTLHAELGQIVAALESGQGALDESLAQFERGMKLLRVCHQKLDAAAQRIEIVTQMSSDGDIETQDFDATSTLQKSTAASGESSSAVRPPRKTKVDEDDDGGLLF